MTKEKEDSKHSKLILLASKDKDTIVKIKNKHLNVKKEKRCNSLDYHQKTGVEQNAKKKHKKRSKKVPVKLNTSHVSSKYNERICDHQIQQLNLTLKQSLNCPTLTQDELKILFMKYKLDGHYRPNNNLPPFSSFIDNVNNAINGERHFYDEIKHSALSSAQEMNCKNNKDITKTLCYDTNDENQHTKENLHAYRNIQLNLKHNSWKPKEIVRENSIDNKIDNKYLHIERNSVVNSNYNQTTNYDIQACSNANVFNTMQNFDQFKSSLNVNEISNIEEKQVSCNLMNAQSSLSEECQSYGYTGKGLFYNVPDSNVQCENLNKYSEMSEKDIKYAIHFNDLPLNSNLCNDFHLNKWNNVSSINKNNNVQSWKSVESVCAPYANTLESHYNVKNSVVPFQLTLINSHSEEQSNFNSHVHANVYHLMNSENMSYIANNSSFDVQQNFNSSCTSSSTVTSDNILPEINTFIPSYANIID